MAHSSFRRSGILAAAVLGGCQAGTADITSVSVLLKQPPGNVEAAVVTVARIDLIGPHGPVALLHQPQIIDLLDRDQVPIGVVNDYAVPAAPYHELRVHVRGAYLAVRNADGTVTRYATPDYAAVPVGAGVDRVLDLGRWAREGQAVTLAGGSLDLRDDQTVLVLELDALRSIGTPVGQAQVAFEPVITAAELGSMGGIRVTLTRPADAGGPVDGATVALFDASRTLIGVTDGFTDTDADGVFEAMFGLLSPGTYEVVVSPPSGWALQTAASSVSVALGEASEAHFDLVASR
ncbi:MAG: MSCRAMM family protein [Gemmatimonadota bacterium]